MDLLGACLSKVRNAVARLLSSLDSGSDVQRGLLMFVSGTKLSILPRQCDCAAASQSPDYVQQARWSFKMLCVIQTRAHSPRTLLTPRNRNCRNPCRCLICPNTGSTIAFRRA